MPTRDIRSDLLPQLAMNQNITSNTTTNGFIFDTANFDGGIVFTLALTAFTDGTYTPSFEEGEDAGLSDAATVPAASIIGTTAGAVLTALTAEGDILPSLGLVGTKRFVRLVITSTGVTTGADLVSEVLQSAEIKPDTGLSA
ncbi:hypothetical protein LCGC14_2855050 [marine sediment metagenome]|uniref:Uncharacterized protein n=1 Tax=marine sediment metagenome TaxID=412755 RepID=A0A0F9AFK1_9ZZZZ|nr:hypothetical protein [Candidatus Scalindua sp.]